MRIALIGSLAVNLIVLGLFVGAILRFDHGMARHADRMSMGLALYIRALPDVQQTQVWQAADAKGQSRSGFMKDLRARQRALEAVLTAEPFSETDVRAALTSHRDFAMGATVKVQDAFVNALVGLSADERAMFLKRVEDMRKSRDIRRKEKTEKQP
jgi:uncharacterized membrane protein